MEKTLYHVMLDGRTLGPYDTRTIVGMRVKNTLADDSVLIRADGQRCTVEDLVQSARPRFDASRSGAHSIVHGTYEGEIMRSGRGGPLPPYEGVVEVRAQSDVLRVAGRLRGKDDRVKVPQADVVHARSRDSVVELWLRGDSGKLQPAAIRLMSPEVAKELVGWLPAATPPPPELAVSDVRIPMGIVLAVVGAVVAILVVVFALALKR